MSVEKIYTDNLPLLDEVVYYLKIIAEDIILKEDEIATANETLQSIKASDLYIMCIEGTARIELFNYTESQLLNAGALDTNINGYIKDYTTIPDNIKSTVLKTCISNYIENYTEYNNYYRKIHGLPNINQDKIKIPDIYVDKIPIGYVVDTGKYISDMAIDEQDILVRFGIIDSILIDYPDHKYLKYIGSKSIDIYKARKASQFGLLYLPTNIPQEVSSRFIDKLELCRVFTLKTVYSDAYKYGSDYYDNFIRIFIIVQAMMDVIVELPDFMIKKDLFDLRMIKLVFESNGIDYFTEIPFKYQISMIKNLNRLIKYKSTTKNIIDICTLFGCDNIEVFKYYILKQRKIDSNGKYINEYTSENGESIEDVEANYELKFLQVPIDDIADNYLHDSGSYLSYDEVTSNDKYWDGDIAHDIIKKEILNTEFNYMQSKYMSIDTVYNLTDMSFQQIYFYNMIFDNKKAGDLLKLNVPTIDTVALFKMSDILCYLFSIMYIDLGIQDKLMDTMGKVLTIKGFNFNADIQTLATYVENQGFTLEELGVSDFQIPNYSVLTYEQLMTIFTKNTKIYNHVVKQLRTANNKQIYDIYKKIYDSLMFIELSMDFFKKSDGNIAKTYTDFLQDRSIILYNSLCDIRAITDSDLKTDRINKVIGDTIYILEAYLKNTDFPYIFSNFPTVSAESIKDYIYKVIDFFKSYKTQIYNINTIYKFSDNFENHINIIDGIYGRIYEYTKDDTIELIEKIVKNLSLEYHDGINIIDNLYRSISQEITKYFIEKYNINDKTQSLLISKTENDYIDIFDSIEISTVSE